MTVSFQQCLDALGGLVRASRPPAGGARLVGACDDSREVRPGWLFCAVPGMHADGARFVPQAVQAGAVAVLAVRPLELPAQVGIIEVSDAYAASGRIAELFMGAPGRQLKLVGVTGTNGKTTCAYLLQAILEHAGTPTGMIGTVVYRIGGRELPAERTTPPAFGYQRLLRGMVDARLAAAVVEVSSHALHQRRVGTARFAGALFTNLTGDHLDYHGDMESYFAAKRRLFTECLAPDGVAVVNVDDPYGARLRRDVLTGGRFGALFGVGFADDGDVRVHIEAASVVGSRFRLVGAWGDLLLETPLIGRHNIANVAGAATLALALGVAPETVGEAIRVCHGAPGRLEAIRSPRGFTVFVDYAHTDDALRHALETLRDLRPNRLAVVFGCGGDRDRSKRPRMGAVAAELADLVYVTSDNPRSEDPEAIIAEIVHGMPSSGAVHRLSDRREAITRAVAAAGCGDIVLVAGKGHETYQEAAGRKSPFDDAAEVRTAIAASSDGA